MIKAHLNDVVFVDLNGWYTISSSTRDSIWNIQLVKSSMGTMSSRKTIVDATGKGILITNAFPSG